MKRPSHSHLSFLLFVGLLVSGMLVHSTSAFAVEAAASPSPGVLPSPGSSWSVEQPACNTFCSNLVNGKGQVVGLTGATGWTTADDQWCANHAAQTNPAVSTALNLQQAPAQATPCPVPMYSGDTSCEQTEAQLAHCQYHNGQVEQQCEAYVGAEQTKSGQIAMISMDAVVAATCGAACASQAFAGNKAVMIACRDGGMAANAAELIVTLSQKSSAVAKLIQASSAAFGIGSSIKSAMSFQDDSTPGAGGPNQGAAGYFKGNKADTGDGKKPNRDKAACTSALTFAVMVGTRYESLKGANSTEQSACNQVLSLATSSPVVGSGILIPLSMVGGGGSTGATGGSTGATGTGTVLNCVGSGGSIGTCTGTTTVSPSDASVLGSSGIASQLAAPAAAVAPSVASGLDDGTGSAGGAISAAGGTGDAGNAVITLASKAQDLGIDPRGEVAGTQRSGGGGAAPEAAADDANPLGALADLLKGQGGGQTTNGVGTTVFNGPAKSNDIWHTSTTDNLFQVVTDAYKSHSNLVSP